MTSDGDIKGLVAVVGAGPAGIYASKYLGEAGIRVALFNRDIKPGGLAEYGIYPSKHRMKQGLRKVFREVLSSPLNQYFGNVTIGDPGDFSLAQLRAMGFQAILATVGAQGTKWLGLPGEDLQGVYHAKDLVYHYNGLPPFSQQHFAIGRRAALIGVGNVMADIAHWLIREMKIDTVTAVARRGPEEIKFTKAEFQYVAANLNVEAFSAELERVRARMAAVSQDPEGPKEFVLSALPKAEERVSDTELRFRFLSSPSRILGNDQGQVVGLQVDDTELVIRDGVTKPQRTGTSQVLDVDTVVFCIGDRVDPSLGLPVEWNQFVKNPHPRFPVEDISYETFDPTANAPINDVFVAGWSREASSGLVGAARKDGQNGARAVMAYLETLPQDMTIDLSSIKERVFGLEKPVVSVDDLNRLYEFESAEAERKGLEHFKLTSNPAMLQAMGK